MPVGGSGFPDVLLLGAVPRSKKMQRLIAIGVALTVADPQEQTRLVCLA